MLNANRKRIGNGTLRLTVWDLEGYFPAAAWIRTGFNDVSDAVNHGRRMLARSITVVDDATGITHWQEGTQD